MELENVRIGYALCGSFCTFEKAFAAMEKLRDLGALLTPIMSFNAASVNSRFGTAENNISRAEQICGRPVIKTIADAEPIGPSRMFDLLICAPCTGNTAAKLCRGITDTPVTMGIKSHLRNNSPVLVGFSTNDALTASAPNIAELLNRKNYFFVPMRQDSPHKKPASVVADFDLLPAAAVYALQKKQLQPVITAAVDD